MFSPGAVGSHLLDAVVVAEMKDYLCWRRWEKLWVTRILPTGHHWVGICKHHPWNEKMHHLSSCHGKSSLNSHTFRSYRCQSWPLLVPGQSSEWDRHEPGVWEPPVLSQAHQHLRGTFLLSWNAWSAPGTCCRWQGSEGGGVLPTSSSPSLLVLPLSFLPNSDPLPAHQGYLP